MISTSRRISSSPPMTPRNEGILLGMQITPLSLSLSLPFFPNSRFYCTNQVKLFKIVSAPKRSPSPKLKFPTLNLCYQFFTRSARYNVLSQLVRKPFRYLQHLSLSWNDVSRNCCTGNPQSARLFLKTKERPFGWRHEIIQ